MPHADTTAASTPTAGRLGDALAAWSTLIGADRVSTDERALAERQRDTSDFATAAVAVLRPASADQVSDIVLIAREHGIALYPVSTGRNWGYGSGNAPRSGCAILDLSDLRGISLDAEFGLVTLEPGVTQGMLRDWLDERRHAFMVPTTGAGPSTSLLSNALERGYGITPITDHAAAVVSLEAVLADGTTYRSPLRDYSGAAGFRWGLGPYLDGIFSQGTAGIVTSMTLSLAPLPDRVQAFYFWLENEEDLERAVLAIRRIRQQAGGTVGGINLMSAMRLVAMSQPYPDLPANEALSEETANEIAAGSGLGAWMGVGTIYGTPRHAAATRALVRRELKGVARRVLFMTASRARRLARVARHIPATQSTARTLEVMANAIDLMRGEPSEATLALPYWKTGRPLPGSPLHPARDGAGILWYSPVIPLSGDQARTFATMVRRVCAEHGFEAPITLTTVSDSTFDSTLPLLFDALDPEQCARADACWRALYEAGRELGFHPYRVHHRYTDLVVDSSHGYWRALDTITRALDPAGTLTPGRWVVAN